MTRLFPALILALCFALGLAFEACARASAAEPRVCYTFVRLAEAYGGRTYTETYKCRSIELVRGIGWNGVGGFAAYDCAADTPFVKWHVDRVLYPVNVLVVPCE